jgi:hypothetical protein
VLRWHKNAILAEVDMAPHASPLKNTKYLKKIKILRSPTDGKGALPSLPIRPGLDFLIISAFVLNLNNLLDVYGKSFIFWILFLLLFLFLP